MQSQHTNYLLPATHAFRCTAPPGSCESEVAQSCLTLCNPGDCSLPGFSIHGIFQARVLEWVAISFSRGFSRPRDRTRVSCIVGRCFTIVWKIANLWKMQIVRISKSLGFKSTQGYQPTVTEINTHFLQHSSLKSTLRSTLASMWSLGNGAENIRLYKL